MISKAIESSQSKVEGMNFDARNHVLEYDDVMNKHREVFYAKRMEVLENIKSDNSEEYILGILKKANFSKEDYYKRKAQIGEDNAKQIEKFIPIKVLDTYWIEHLENMNYLRDSVRLRAYGQQDPLIEYKREGHGMFKELLNTIESTIANAIMKADINVTHKPKPVAVTGNKIGRNDPCHCKSGKKYKKCHGK